MTERSSAERLHRWCLKVPEGAIFCAVFRYRVEASPDPLDVFPATLPTVQMVQALLESMEDDASDEGSTQEYTIAWTNKDGGQLKTKHYTVEMEQDAGTLADAPEAANATGLVRQAMRHSEAMAKLFVANMGTALQVTKEVMELQQQQLRTQSRQMQALLTQLAVMQENDEGDTPEDEERKDRLWARLEGVAARVLPDVITVAANAANGAAKKASVTDVTGKSEQKTAD